MTLYIIIAIIAFLLWAMYVQRKCNIRDAKEARARLPFDSYETFDNLNRNL